MKWKVSFVIAYYKLISFISKISQACSSEPLTWMSLTGYNFLTAFVYLREIDFFFTG